MKRQTTTRAPPNSFYDCKTATTISEKRSRRKKNWKHFVKLKRFNIYLLSFYFLGTLNTICHRSLHFFFSSPLRRFPPFVFIFPPFCQKKRWAMRDGTLWFDCAASEQARSILCHFSYEIRPYLFVGCYTYLCFLHTMFLWLNFSPTKIFSFHISQFRIESAPSALCTVHMMYENCNML